MKLAHLQEHWDRWGTTDPLWAILSDHRGIDDFFQRGRSEVAKVMTLLAGTGLEPQRGRALDFGCGMGRLTQALCEHFEEVDGVDIAPSMIELARQHNRRGARCRYVLNADPDLSLFPDGVFDFVYTNIVLQHMRPSYARGYIREFFRVLKPGGVAAFQVPGELIPAGDGIAAIGPARETALPDDACRAEITVTNAPPRRPVGMQFELRVNMRNTSPHPWPAARTPDGRHQLVLVNRWLDARGNIGVEDDGRALLPGDLAPEAQVTLPLIIAAPEQPDLYRLEVDILEEGIGRFAERGGCAAYEKVTVFAPVQPNPEAKPRIQMYALGRRAVLELVGECGGRVARILDNRGAGPWWTSQLYLCQASTAPPPSDREEDEQAAYERLVPRVRDIVRRNLPPDAIVAIVSKGDEQIVKIGGPSGWHFPQDEDGVYAGFYFAGAADAIRHLEAVHAKGATHLLFPATSLWWLQSYGDLRRHLDEHCPRVWSDEHCVIYELAPACDRERVARAGDNGRTQ